jgi:DNA end-binding protein Ku
MAMGESMRSIWSGMISFGLINIPVKMYVATQEQGINFDYLNRKDLSPIRYARVDRSTGEEVAYRDIVRGVEYEKGNYVVLQDEDFRRASVRKTQTIDVVDFTAESAIDIKLLEKPFYLEPAKEARKVYALLREALYRSGKVGVARFVLRTREHMGILKAEGDVIVLDQIRFASEIRKPAGLALPKNEAITDNEIDLALRLIDQLSQPFHPEKFKDTYTEELKSMIENKARGKIRHVHAEKQAPTKVPDLLARLKESLEDAHRR